MPNLGNIELRTLDGIFEGDPLAIYPRLKKIGAETWDWPVWVTAIQFSTTLTVFPSDLGGMLLTFGKIDGEYISVSQGLQSVICHLTAPNSITGTTPIAVPSSKVSNISFGGGGYYLPAKSPLTLFAFANTTADGNYLAAVASIQYRRQL